MMRNNFSTFKRGLSLFLVLMMCLSLLQVTAFAEDGEEGTSEDGQIMDVESGEDTQQPEEGSEESNGDTRQPEEGSEGSNEDARQPEEGGGESEEDTQLPGEGSEGSNGDSETAGEPEDSEESEETEVQPISGESDAGTEGEGTETETEEEVPALNVVFEEKTGTLTITGTGEVTAADVATYKAALKNLIVEGKDITIGELAFRDCKNLDNVVIKDVAEIGYEAFLSTNVKNLEISGVDTIAKWAFYNSPMLEKVSISDVSTIGEDIFHVYLSVTNLAEVSLSNIDTISNQMFKDCKQLTTVSLTEIGSIGFQAFMNCTSLTELDLSGVETLGTSAFLGCTGLTKLELDGVEIGETVFYGCTGLTDVTVKNVDAIGQQAFTGCTGLKTVTLADIGTIGEQVFSYYGSVLPACTALKTVTMTNIGTIGKNAFTSCKALEDVTMSGIDTIGQYAFQNCTSLETVKMDTIRLIDNYAFWNCSNLTTINSLSNVTERIGGFAFFGCKSLTGLTVADLTKMGYVGTSEEIMKRVKAILAGKFQLDDASEIKTLTLDSGWAAGDIGRSDNWSTYDNGTQLMEQARWQNAATGTAEVKVDAYYTAEKQMDYIFVADLSGSMAQLGNPEDGNARFYDMQSKLLDMTGKLLDTDGYDCQVAIVTFGGYVNDTNPGSTKVMEFTGSVSDAQSCISALEPLNENTDYVLGLNEVLKLMGSHNPDRDTVVVFLSDGRPNYDGTTELKTVSQLNDYNDKIVGVVGQIKAAGVDGIYGVLHSPGAAAVEYAKNAMNAVCDNYYTSTDTESFGNAMNAAFSSAYGSHTVTIPVNSEQFDVSGLPTDGSVSYDADSGIITWDVAMPFTQHTLTYTLTLKEDLANRYGTYTYSINNGEATFGEGESTATLTLDLTLTRTLQDPTPTTAAYTIRHEYYTNGALTGVTTATAFDTIGSVIAADSIGRVLTYGGAAYSFTSASANVTVLADGSAIITLRYDRTVYVPTPTPTPTPGGTGGGTTGGGTGGTDIGENDTPLGSGETEISDNETPLASGLIRDRVAYLAGYEDATVRPTNNITRAEVATVFYRLMDDQNRALNWGDTNAFTDVAQGQWYNEAISTAANAGILLGYGDSSFKPNQNITRAEFAAIVSRFLSVEVESKAVFSDVSGHWAEEAIGIIAGAGWITGYEDGTFRPDQTITRAEAAIIINRMLGRDIEDRDGDTRTWIDNPMTAWFYEDIQEATNGTLLH